MPLTPFHWSVVLFGFILFDVLYLPALIISSVLMDLEPFYYMFIAPRPDGVLHGFFHTYIGVTLIAIVVALLLIKFRKPIDQLAAVFKVSQPKVSNKWIIASSLLAAWSHVLLDSFMHADLQPFWPATTANPFLRLLSINDIYLFTGIGLLVTFALWVIHLVKQK